jgi:hypothetical protein
MMYLTKYICQLCIMVLAGFNEVRYALQVGMKVQCHHVPGVTERICGL